MNQPLERGRSAYEQRAWGDAYEALAQASADGALAADDVERLAWSALLTGHDAASLDALARLHELRIEAGEAMRAARAAIWLAMRSMSLGEHARGGGWFARAQRLVEREGGDCVESGYLQLPAVFRCSAAGDHDAARAAAAHAAAIGDRHADRDLSAFARNLEGRALIRLGRLAEGLALMDEAMLAVTSGALAPFITGVVYCSVIAACQQSYALERAREWTAALDDWCRAQPQLVQFAGACLVHRSEIMQLGGAWSEAFEEARRASTRLAPTTNVEAGNAFYQEGELLRLRGELEQAERAYVLASERGRDPQPGRALLRLAEGRVDLAAAATRRVLSATSDPLQRTRFLPAHLEIMLAANDLDEARRAADELAATARQVGMEMLDAIADHARGAVALAQGDARAAIDPLRRAQEVWQRASAPYLSARIRVLMARAYASLGDEDSATLELENAKKVFVQLGAVPDLKALEALRDTPASAASAPAEGTHGLSPRELQVLLLVAAGKTNKDIARELFVSDRTVDRHVSNIFAKLDLSSRSAATAWAYQRGLLT